MDKILTANVVNQINFRRMEACNMHLQTELNIGFRSFEQILMFLGPDRWLLVRPDVRYEPPMRLRSTVVGNAGLNRYLSIRSTSTCMVSDIY